MIPEAAVEAAAKALRGYTGDCTCHEAYAGRNLIDPECLYHDVPAEAARDILEAAAPHLMAEAWDEGYRGCYDRYMYDPAPSNPYRKDSK